jgi:hypothetical protein
MTAGAELMPKLWQFDKEAAGHWFWHERLNHEEVRVVARIEQVASGRGGSGKFLQNPGWIRGRQAAERLPVERM